MRSNILVLTLLLLLPCSTRVTAICDYYSPAFPLPELRPDDSRIEHARDKIRRALDEALVQQGLNATSFSVEVTSSTETLFELHHTAQEKNPQRQGAEVVDGTSCYRIASITKAFTVLGILQQQVAGKLNLDDSVNVYIPELGEKSAGGIPWKDISIRTLASQLSGIPREMGQADILANVDNPIEFGLPPVPKDTLVQCDVASNFTRPCGARDLLAYLNRSEPIFPPKQESTYSNLNFELLGLVLENVTGIQYEEYIHKHVLKGLKMPSTSFLKPSDDVAVLPRDHMYFWDVEMDIENPTGGLYSSSADMANFARYVLTHYNGLTPALNWFNPVSYGTGVNSFYGMPWEINRLSHVFPYTGRPITVVMKGGSLPGYTSTLSMLPEYGFGYTILVGGDQTFLQTAKRIILENMLPAVEAIAQQQMSQKHVGTFSAAADLDLNSSIVIAHSPAKGLHIASWISNGTDVIDVFDSFLGDGSITKFQLVPTLLFKDELKKEGEIWRILRVQAIDRALPDEFCMTDIDYASFGGLPLNEVVFWNEAGGQYQVFEPVAFRIKLDRDSEKAQPSHPNEDDFAYDHDHVQHVVSAKIATTFPDRPIRHFRFMG